MKIIINEGQYKKIVDELNVKTKDIFGSGMEHYIFPSKTNPNILYKVGRESTIMELYNYIKEGPEFFPKLYGIKKLNGIEKLAHGRTFKEDIYYLILEKLETKKFVLMCDSIFPVMYEQDIFASFRHFECFTVVKRFLEDKEERDFCDKVVKLLSGMKKKFGDGPFFDFDLHKYNFGIDSNGEIKCLDL